MDRIDGKATTPIMNTSGSGNSENGGLVEARAYRQRDSESKRRMRGDAIKE